MAKILSFLLFTVYKLLVWSWRIEIHETEDLKNILKQEGKDSSFIIAHWHGEEFGILHLIKRYDVASIVSTSKDGELMNNAIKLLGGATVRGSSSKKGVQALKGIIRLAKEGKRPSVAVDGPKGPRHVVKPGVFEISRAVKLPIIPLAIYCSRSHVFHKAWNKAELPLPFSRVVICWGAKLDAIERSQDTKSKELGDILAKGLHNTRKKAKLILDE